MFWEFAFNHLDFEFRVFYIYKWSRFSIHVPTAVFSGVRILHVMPGAVMHITLFQ